MLEPTALLTYKPDTTNNYEAGVKGTAFNLYYSADVFYIDWNKPQIDLLTPFNLTAVVVNGNGASSTGVEFEVSGPIGPKGLSFNLGAAYAKARLTKDFELPAGSGGGTVVPDAITGLKGDRLPGAPDFSGSGNINYKYHLQDLAALTFSIGADYRSSTVNILPNINPNTPASSAPAYVSLHGSIVYENGPWEAELFGTNLADKRIVLAAGVRTLASYPLLGNWGNSYAIGRPREIGLRLTRHF